MIGQTISHYKILSKLGEGGIGDFNRAENSQRCYSVLVSGYGAFGLEGSPNDATPSTLL